MNKIIEFQPTDEICIFSRLSGWLVASFFMYTWSVFISLFGSIITENFYLWMPKNMETVKLQILTILVTFQLKLRRCQKHMKLLRQIFLIARLRSIFCLTIVVNGIKRVWMSTKTIKSTKVSTRTSSRR